MATVADLVSYITPIQASQACRPAVHLLCTRHAHGQRSGGHATLGDPHGLDYLSCFSAFGTARCYVQYSASKWLINFGFTCESGG